MNESLLVFYSTGSPWGGICKRVSDSCRDTTAYEKRTKRKGKKLSCCRATRGETADCQQQEFSPTPFSPSKSELTFFSRGADSLSMQMSSFIAGG
ncbi:hypothetical protein NPIL_510441 [Nephila pilipes]|uniref:Uncharacterized protein n=1 Tax=Nephila pilipes TaxID=299642 RepID=A0A8X6Q9T2_NEPPI|nr:hypothetical protein NPIL_510441 [Nephila pilipes]